MPYSIPVNAINDMLQLILPKLEEIGEELPSLNIYTPEGFMMLLQMAIMKFPAGSNERNLAQMHLDDLRKVLK